MPALPDIDLTAIDLTDAREFHPITHPLLPCPHCGEKRLGPVRDGDTVNFLCAACGRCWHVELLWVRQVDPRSCEGCPHPTECRMLFALDHETVAQTVDY